MSSVVYFLRKLSEPETQFQVPRGWIKIGYTSDYQKRAYYLRKQFGNLELLALMKGGYDEEQALHDRFYVNAGYRQEFFVPTQELLGFIARLPPYTIPLPLNYVPGLWLYWRDFKALRNRR